jgi:Zn-dependent protease with chaperone function
MRVDAIAAVLSALAVAPHFVPQHRLDPAGGIILWTAALLFRAMLGISVALIIVLYLPATEFFTLLTHWCLESFIPVFTSHLGLDGHRVGDAALVVPAIAIALSVLSLGFGLWRGARAVRRWLARSAIGPGPAASLIVAEPEIILAAAGLKKPRVIVSAGALLRLDDDELEAGLEHEWGHVRRHHRRISTATEIFAAFARFVPGTQAALSNLRYCLERDADEYAVERTGNPLALASVICKAAQGEAFSDNSTVASLAGSGVSERLARLASDSSDTPSRIGAVFSRTLAFALTVAAMGLAATLPTLAAAERFEQPDRAAPGSGASCV